MARPSGCKNALPSKRDQRRLLRDLREKADKGSPEAAGFLVMIGTLARLAERMGESHG